MTESRAFGSIRNGEEARLYTIHGGGLTASFTDLGARAVSLLVPDREGKMVDVILGLDDAPAYDQDQKSLSALVGRVCNRTEGAAFRMNGKTYRLAKNDHGKNNLHSNPGGFHTRMWSLDPDRSDDHQVTFLIYSPDGDEGFPGNLTMTVTYALEEDASWRIIYRAKCDADTPLNPTNHTYFNLAGHDSGDVLSHEIRIDAKFYTPVKDSESIPTGEILPVEGSPFDFLTPHTIGERIDSGHPQLKYTGGYDHNYVFAKEKTDRPREVAEAYSGETGIRMRVLTDMPGMQFYTGNFLKDLPGKNGSVYPRRAGFCFETQYFPNSLNEPSFTSPILPAGEEFVSETVYAFSVK